MSRSASPLRKTLLVGWREFRFTALTPAFLLGVVAVPLAMLGLLAIYPILLFQEPVPLEGTLVIIDPSGEVAPIAEGVVEGDELFGNAAERVEELMSGIPGASGTSSGALNAFTAATDLTIQSVTNLDELESLKDEVREGNIIAVASVSEMTLDTPNEEDDPEGTVELFISTESPPHHTAMLEQILRESVVQTRAEREGIDYQNVKQILEPPSMEVVRVLETGESPEDIRIRMALPIALMMLLWISTFTSGNYVLTTTIEEKSNKVMEVLLSAVSPMQLMTGKILGQAVVAIFMLVMYGGMAIGVLAALAMSDLISVSLLLLSIAYFVIAYFTVASMMAAIGSAVNDLRDAQSLMGPAVIVLILPLILWLPITSHPESMLSVVAGLIPPLLPFVMILRVTASAEPLPLWQIIASLTIGGVSVFAMLWMCARIFRIGVLMQGKPPSPLELLRWIRYR